MGRDKATLLVGGLPMAVRVARALEAAGAAEVVCVGPSVGALRAIAEDAPGEGPLGAVVAAVGWAAPRPVVVAACDLVAPAAATFAAVVAALGDPTADAAVPVLAGRRQPLVAAYAASSLAALVAAFEGGERSISAALRELRVVELAGLDPSHLADADEPGDLPR